jgi:D-amino-acid dehydrogenase
MRVLVLGAGVVGVSTAYQLLKDGHEVVVVERNSEAAAETSFANAGLIAPGHSFAWASPKVPKILLKSLYDDRQAFRFRPRLDWRMWMWTLKFLGQCTGERARANTLNKHRLCVYSEEVLHQVVAETAIDYDRVTGGNLYIYRSQATLDRALVTHHQHDPLILGHPGQPLAERVAAAQLVVVVVEE